ncbi:MAG: transketolase [Minwuiales bacterium]|nr:transketolase [Minwuiales bacterium]
MTDIATAPSPSAASHADMANAIRALAMDAVQQANSGHPGMPMGMADVATVLFTRFLKFDPARPDWPDRDRFVLSAGHGSMLLYSLLHLTGYEDLPLEELRQFRQLGSRTAGHPEFGAARGIETTTGPLGQGLGNAVGMALAERILAARFGDDLIDHYTYALAGDGCLMEGISHEAIDLAGHLKLRKLIVLFDDNHISIDGPTGLASSMDHRARFAAAGWNTFACDGHDPEAIATAIEEAKASERPALIACRTVIGYGAPNLQGTAKTHGSPLGADEIEAAREKLGWPHPPFEIPPAVRDAWLATGAKGAAASAAWRSRLNGTSDETRAEFERVFGGYLPATFDAEIEAFKRQLANDQPTVATRQASGNTLEVLSAALPELIGGSADLTGSNNTKTKAAVVVDADNFAGTYIHYGVREHGMAAAMNGMALHGGVIPYGGTFLVFTDYCRPSIRLAALMEQRVVFVMTHDSIGLGEDGPTHQPVEHIAALRAMPNVNVLRPADAVETAECWAVALKSANTPSVLALTRQGLPTLRTEHTADNLSARGGYELMAADGTARVTILATGSEVSLAVEARDRLQADGIGTRVVSMPCFELFDSQDEAYREEVLGPGTLRIAVEAAVGFGWERYLGTDGVFVGMDGFGASAPYKQLYEEFGITAETIAGAARARL